jgi:hypothetical protein
MAIRSEAGEAGLILPAPHAVPPGAAVAQAASVKLDHGHIEIALTVMVHRANGASVVIDMPRFRWSGESDPFPDRHFPDLTITIDGAPAHAEDSSSAFAGKTDITDILHVAGVDPFVIAEPIPILERWPGSAAALAQLKTLGAVKNSGPDISGQPLLALWSAERHVKMTLSQSGIAMVTLAYDGRPGDDLLNLDTPNAARRLTPYCLDVPALDRLLDHAKAGVTIREYAIPATIGDQPAGAVTVELGAPGTNEQPQALAAFCGADGKPVIMRGSDAAKAAARPDAQGVVRILSVKAL